MEQKLSTEDACECGNQKIESKKHVDESESAAVNCKTPEENEPEYAWRWSYPLQCQEPILKLSHKAYVNEAFEVIFLQITFLGFGKRTIYYKKLASLMIFDRPG